MNNVKMIGRCLDGVKVIAYVLVDEAGKKAIVPKQDVENMVMNKGISNVTGQLYEGRVNLRGVGFKLVDLPKYDLHGVRLDEKAIKKARNVYSLRAKIVKGREILGYVVQKIGDNGEYLEKKMKREEVMKLASEGKIANVRVQMNNGVSIMRGVARELEGLPAIKLE